MVSWRRAIFAEEGGLIPAYDDDGDLLRTVAIPDLGDTSLGQVDINTAEVAYLDVNLVGSGAITALSFNSWSEVESYSLVEV